MRPIYLKLFIFVSILSLCTGCSLKKAATTTIGKVAQDGTKVIEAEQDVDLARQTTPSLIITLEVLSQGNPQDKRMLTLLARSYGQYAFGFLEEDLLRYKDSDEAAYQKSLKRTDLFYNRGKDYGLKALWSPKEQERVLFLPQDEFERELKGLGKKQVASLFWAAFCWGNLINLHRDDPQVFVDLPRVEAMMRRVVTLNPSYYYGSAHTFLGALAATRPPMLGGDPEKARQEFNAAIGMEDGYLMHKVLYAQYYAVRVQDKALYEDLLRTVANADANIMPGQRLANEMAKRRADILLQKARRFF